MNNINQITLIIIVATVIVSMKGFKDYGFFDKYKFQVSRIKSGEKYRMFSSGLLHADWIHLFFNMYALYLFGNIVGANFGNSNYLMIYLGSLLTGSMYSLYYNKDKPYYSAIGASGAVSGIVFSAVLLYPHMTLTLFPIPLPMPGYVFGIGYLLYSIYGMKKSLGNIGHSAHLGGAIGGFVLTLLLRPTLAFEEPLITTAMGIIIIGVLLFGNKLEA